MKARGLELLAEDLTDDYIRQLYYIQQNSPSNTTFQSSVEIGKMDDTFSNINIEVKRRLTSFSCMKLLENGGEDSYNKFVVLQPEDSKLSYDEFKNHSSFITSLSIEERKVEEVACFIAISNKSRQIMIENGITPNPDSEQILTQIANLTITNPDLVRKILPATNSLNDSQLKNLLSIYADNFHLRHWLFGEKMAIGMMPIVTALYENKLSKAGFKLALIRWILNVCGFEGHKEQIDPITHKIKANQGSTFLDSGINRNINLLLKIIWEPIIKNPENFQSRDQVQKLVDNYYEQTENGNKIVGWITCYTMSFKDAQISELNTTFNKLPKQTKNNILYIYNSIQQGLPVTYMPGALTNYIAAAGGYDGLKIFTSIAIPAFQKYSIMREEFARNGKILPPLNMNNFGKKENVSAIIDYYYKNGEIPDFSIDNKTGQIDEITFHKQSYKHVGDFRIKAAAFCI
jgi:hypothetical protein